MKGGARCGQRFVGGRRKKRSGVSKQDAPGWTKKGFYEGVWAKPGVAAGARCDRVAKRHAALEPCAACGGRCAAQNRPR